MQAAAEFDARQTAKKLLRESRDGSLATLMAGKGDPYCSLVNVATATDGSPLLLISRLALHTKNIVSDPRVSLLLHERTHGDPLHVARVMLMGRAMSTDAAADRRRYLVRHVEAEKFTGFGDFGFYRITLERAHLVAGFGRIVDLAAGDLVTDLDGAEAVVEGESEIVAHINSEHADTARLYATKLLGAADGSWCCVGCDPEGLELQHDRVALRLPFAQPIKNLGPLRQQLKALADQARSR